MCIAKLDCGLAMDLGMAYCKNTHLNLNCNLCCSGAQVKEENG